MTSFRRATFGLSLASLACCGRLGAQSAPDRAALQLFRDSLSFTADTVKLHRLEAQTIEVARQHRDDPLLHIRLGFLALRIRELGGNVERVDHAASEFEWAGELHPEWPYPWFGLGLAEASAPDRAPGFAGGLWTMLGIDRDTRAGAAFARAIKADPGFVDGLVAFAETARTQRIKAPLVAALDALRLAQSSTLSWDAALLLERGRLERIAGSADSARFAFRRAILVGFRPAMASFELARTLPLTSDTFPLARGQPLPVELAYYKGAESDEPEVVAMYRRDLQPIVDDSVLREFDRSRGDARVQWLRDFWRTRAAVDMRTPGALLTEHLRRWDEVTRHFRLSPFRRSYRWGIETFQSHDGDLDDRGIVWLRQGAPQKRIVWPLSQPRDRNAPRPAPMFRLPQIPGSLILDPPVGDSPGDAPTFGNETWRYVRPDGDMVLNFTAQDDPDDFRLVETILQLNVSFDAMLDHSADLPGLAEMLRAGPVGRVGMANEDRLKGKKAIGVATTTNAWPRNYSITMGGRAQWLMAGARDGMPLVHIVYGIDAGMLSVLPVVQRTGLIPITIRAVFIDNSGHPVASLDTVQMLHRPAGPAGLVAARAEVPVPPGTMHMRLDVEANRAIGTIYPLDTLAIPDIRDGSLALSSIVMGIRGRSLSWVPENEDTVWLAPSTTFQQSDTLSVFVEGYGVHPAESYTVHLGLTRQRSALIRFLKGHRESVTLTEHLSFPSETAELRRSIPLQGLEPGSYILQVVVEGGGRSITRRRALIISAPESPRR